MADNLPLQLDMAESRDVGARARASLDHGRTNALYTYGHRGTDEVRREYALAAYRWAVAELGDVPVAEAVDPAVAYVGIGAGGEAL